MWIKIELGGHILTYENKWLDVIGMIYSASFRYPQIAARLNQANNKDLKKKNLRKWLQNLLFSPYLFPKDCGGLPSSPPKTLKAQTYEALVIKAFLSK